MHITSFAMSSAQLENYQEPTEIQSEMLHQVFIGSVEDELARRCSLCKTAAVLNSESLYKCSSSEHVMPPQNLKKHSRDKN